ncbi:MAG: hypothetical protein WCP85_20530 [Mariniphaga sp.]
MNLLLAAGNKIELSIVCQPNGIFGIGPKWLSTLNGSAIYIKNASQASNRSSLMAQMQAVAMPPHGVVAAAR